MWTYNVQTKKWEMIAGMNTTWYKGNNTYPSARMWPASTITNTSIYLFGGFHLSDGIIKIIM